MKELSVVKIIDGKHAGYVGEIHEIKKTEENHLKTFYIVFNSGEGEWFSEMEIIKATKEEEVQFLRNEIEELYKEMDKIEAAHNCLEFDFKILLKTLTNPNEQTIRIAQKRGYDLNPATKTKKIFPMEIM